MNLIEAKNIGVRFGNEKVLTNVNFSIQKGNVVTIVGPNGSGKTTFLRVLIGAQKTYQGSLFINPQCRIGYVPQRVVLDSLMPLTVSRWINFFCETGSEKRNFIIEKLGLENLLDNQVCSLSGGEMQRVMFAQALAVSPNLLVLDEPTQGLDHQAISSFYRLIDTLRDDSGCAVLMVSHDLHVVMRSSDRVICLNRHVCCEGPPTDVSADPEYQALFGFDNESALALYKHKKHDHDT